MNNKFATMETGENTHQTLKNLHITTSVYMKMITIYIYFDLSKNKDSHVAL
jgi:hypothetical protein